MTTVSTIGLDIAKHVFQAHGADASGQAVFRKKITRTKLIDFLASQPRCLVALEACWPELTKRPSGTHKRTKLERCYVLTQRNQSVEL